jgi:hypothetical protein
MQEFLLDSSNNGSSDSSIDDAPSPMLLTFERLAQETAYKLSQTESDITPDSVREVLKDAGIDECLRDTAPTPKGRLTVNQVHIVGEKRHVEHGIPERFEYKRKLGSGLWAWVGANGAGKSTVLNCIVWALTGADAGISRRARSWLSDIAVWFTIGQNQFTSRVSRSAEVIAGGVYPGFRSFAEIDLGAVQAVVSYNNRDDMRDVLDVFFMQQLGITTLRWTAHGSQKDDPDLHAHSTTWRTYAHAIHIEDDSYDDLIIDPQKGYGRQDRKILEMMLGVDHARTVAEIQVQADFAKEAYGRARARVSGRQAGVAEQITLLEQEQADVARAIELLQGEQTPVEDDGALVAKREQRATLLAEQNRLADEIAALQAQIPELERTILEVEREKIAIQEQSEVEYLINSLAVVRCPHCESAVDDQDRLVKERHDHTCHVCMKPIQRVRPQGDLKAILKDRDDEIAELRKSVKRIQNEAHARETKLVAGRDEVTRLTKELETSVNQARQGFTVSYTNLLLRKGQVEGQLAQLRRAQAEIANEQNEVQTAARWHTILQTAAEIADESVYSIYQNAFGELSALVTTLATAFGVPDLEQVIIDEKRYVKLLQGGVLVGHSDLARSERVKFKVAFHLALTLIQVRAGVGKHPGFLIIDTPGTAEVDAPDLIAMIRELSRVHNEYGDKVQILLATARDEAAEALPVGRIERPSANGAFF